MPSTRTWADIAVLLTLAMLGVVGFEPPFGGFGFLLAGIGGLAVGAATGILTSIYRLPVITTTLVAVTGYFLLGSAFAVPGQALAGVFPSLQSLASLAVGAVYGWADIVTLQTPIGAPQYIAVVPFVATWLVALIATTLAARWLPSRPRAAWRHGVMLIGPVLLYLAGVLLGTDTPFQAGVRGVTFAVLALVWLAWRRSSEGTLAAESAARNRRRKLAGTAILVAASVVVGTGSALVLAPPNDQRFVLRDEIEPPFDPLQYPSPLAGFREYSKLMQEDVLFTVDGLAPADRLRLATMDTFTGKLWNVTGPELQTAGSGSFALVGRELPRQDFITADRRENVTVTIEAYDDVWVPSVGYPTDLEFTAGDAADDTDSLRYNEATGTSVLTTGVSEGDSYTIDADVQRVLSGDDLADASPAAISLPPITDNPDITTAKAQELAGSATEPAAQLEAIRLGLAEQGFLSRGLASDAVPSRAGHGADRIDELLSRNQLIGDEEQYASAFALMASTYGYPARVVMGFAPEVVEGQVTEVRGEDVSAWVEVAFEDIGWVAYDPTPDETDIPQDQTPQPQIEPQPQVRQPPRADNDPEDLLTPVELDNEDTDDEDAFVFPTWLVVLALSILIPAAIILIPALIIGALKARRARRRRDAATGDARAAGAWDELVDQYTELGYAVPARSTRPMIARDLERQVPGEEPLPLRSLATATDRAVFSGADLDAASTDEVWSEAIAAVEIARRAVTRSRRILSRYRLHRRRRRRGRA
ncbi:transglutaminaseTgpA domain-containing protein [Marisediminicola sp. LYQ85]|uniref:transglutaminase family protein n=1 Tax=Marisediminicola sp. LYQ85 TaxID=3391062 RepID=UPI003983A661